MNVTRLAFAALLIAGLTASGGRAGAEAAPLTPAPEATQAPAALIGEPGRGRTIALSRQQGLCILCHAFPGVAPHESGTLGPDLSGVASRHDRESLRRRVLEPQAFNPSTLMPSYDRRHHPGARVAHDRQGQALLDAQALADVLAYLNTLK